MLIKFDIKNGRAYDVDDLLASKPSDSDLVESYSDLSADKKLLAVKSKRNILFKNADIMIFKAEDNDDETLRAEVVEYRKALRDITNHLNWPDLSDADWPTMPGV